MNTGEPHVRLDRADIVRGLTALFGELRELNAPARIRLVGGAAISLAYNVDRGSTVDLDAELTPEDVIIDAASRVSTRMGWQSDWLNSAAVQFLPNGFGQRVAEWTTIYDRDNVVVEVATAETLLAMKLFSCQRRRRRELADLRVLLPLCKITTLDHAEDHLAQYYPGEEFTPQAAAVVELALAESFTPDANDNPFD